MNEAELQTLVKSILELREANADLREANAELREFHRRSRLELDQALKESADERDRAIKESADERDRAIKESADERDRAMKASADERDRAIKAAADRTDEAIRKMAGEFSSQWGDLVEALVEPSLVGQFQARGVPITQSTRRMEGIDHAGRQVEIDVLLVNGDAVVAIEVKTKCKVDDIVDYEQTLRRFREAFRQYSGHRIFAGIAAVTFDSDCDRYAYKRGMFVLKPVAGIAQILNDESFVPREF